MSQLAERLRTEGGETPYHFLCEAADRIEMLETAARKALDYIENTESDLGVTLTSGDALREALYSAPPPQDAARDALRAILAECEANEMNPLADRCASIARAVPLDAARKAARAVIDRWEHPVWNGK
jgi:hypothetical protein